MSEKDVFAAVESRAFDARLTMSEVCEKARVPLSTWSRAKTRGTIRVKVLAKIEDALAEVENERAAA